MTNDENERENCLARFVPFVIRHSSFNTVLRAAKVVAPHANATTVAELMGIKIAQTIGDNHHAAAMLTPIRL